MLDLLLEFLPSKKQAVDLILVIFSGIAVSAIGRFLNPQSEPGRSYLLAGWGVGCLVYTATATLTTINLSFAVWTLIALSVVSTVFLIYLKIRLTPPKSWRVFALAASFLTIVSAKYPSEVDVLSHWLYNALYLLDYGNLPREGLPQSFSAYTGFPYNHTFALHFVSVLTGGMAESAGYVINFGLVTLFAVLLADLIHLARTGVHNGSSSQIGWTVAALALILATYANPIFSRKIVLMANPDTATSVVLAFLGINAWQLIERLRVKEENLKQHIIQFSLLALLFINLKQPNIIILAILFLSMTLLLIDKESLKRVIRLIIFSPVLFGPALVSYLLWRGYVSSGAQLQEATLLPFEQWQFDNIPAILGSFWANAVKKAGYFGIMTIITIYACIRLFRLNNSFDRLAILTAFVFIGWNGALFFLYIAHWTGHASTGASSYWRYNTFIGYFGYAVAIYGLSRMFFERVELTQVFLIIRGKIIQQTLVVTAIIMPFVTAPYLRFDRQQPKPYLRTIGNEISVSVPVGSRVLVHIPGDVGDYATVMQYFANRFRPDITVAPAPSISIIRNDLNKEYPSPPMVWSICRTSELEKFFVRKLPADKSFLLIKRQGTWIIEKSWNWPESKLLSSYHKNIRRLRCDITR